MNVLFATYPMAFHTPGGGEIQLLAYQKHLPDFGVEVTLFDPWNPKFLEHDVVHFFSCMGGSSNFCAFVKQIGLPLVVSSSLWITENTKDKYPVDEIRYQLSIADAVIANSDIECENLSTVLGLPREKFHTVYNGVDSHFYLSSSPEVFRSHYKIYEKFILNVGNIEPRKNQLGLLRAMKSFPDLKLVLIGHARTPSYLDEIMSEGGDQLIYIGPLHNESELLRSAYRACEAFVLPSTLETPGLAALEAAAAGSRLVLTSEGACKEYFGNRACYVDPLSVFSIQNGIREALGSELIQDSKWSEKYAWPKLLGNLTSVYNKTKKS